jgi:hypothetical protein
MVATMASAQTSTPGVVDPTATVAAITGNQATVSAIGIAVLAIVVGIAAFKWSKRAI